MEAIRPNHRGVARDGDPRPAAPTKPQHIRDQTFHQRDSPRCAWHSEARRPWQRRGWRSSLMSMFFGMLLFSPLPSRPSGRKMHCDASVRPSSTVESNWVITEGSDPRL